MIDNLLIEPCFGAENALSNDAVLDGEYPLVTFMHSAFDGYDLYMFMNTDNTPCKAEAYIPANENESFGIVNQETLEITPINVKLTDKQAAVALEIPEMSALIICKSK